MSRLVVCRHSFHRVSNTCALQCVLSTVWACEVVAYSVSVAVFAEVVESLGGPFAVDDATDEDGASWCGDGVLECWGDVTDMFHGSIRSHSQCVAWFWAVCLCG